MCVHVCQRHGTAPGKSKFPSKKSTGRDEVPQLGLQTLYTTCIRASVHKIAKNEVVEEVRLVDNPRRTQCNYTQRYPKEFRLTKL